MARTAARGNSPSVTLVSCRQITSGAASAADAATAFGKDAGAPERGPERLKGPGPPWWGN